MIEINERIEVPSVPPRVVWDLLSDPKDVVGCVPGAILGEEHEDGSFDGTMTVKFGPARVTFKARIELDLDESTMTGKVTSRGKDNQGGTRFRAAMGFEVVEQQDPPGSVVLVKGENEISGKLAGLVEAGAKLVIKRISAEFAQNLAARLTGAGATPAESAENKEQP